MRKILVFKDKTEYELTPLTFNEFEKYGKWTSANDVAFSQFLRHNKFHDLEDFSEGLELMQAKIELREGEPRIDWSVTYGDL